MKEIKLKGKLGKGLVALIDDEDFERVNQHKWQLAKRKNANYVQGWINGKHILLHRFVLELNDPKMDVDHINHDGLYNLKSNLRICTRSQNLHNRQIIISVNSKRTSSKFKGVSWHKRANKWRARGTINHKEYPLGLFNNEIEAARAYNEFAKENYGEFAKLNKIQLKNPIQTGLSL